jgi:hypothetical protein
MINIHKYFKTKAGIYLLSVLLGIGVATLFRKVCQGDMCTLFKAPKPELVVDKIFKFDGKCYKYNVEHINCKNNKKTIYFE